jgi:hypothetical protein
MSTEHYTVITSGERFVFTREQMQSEPGNYFATYFLGDFAESKNGVKELVIEKEPLLFKLIQAHLRGYEILPLAEAAIPMYMTKEVALVNLLRESQYYGLQRLEERIKCHRPGIANLTAEMPPPQASSPKAYKFAVRGHCISVCALTCGSTRNISVLQDGS